MSEIIKKIQQGKIGVMPTDTIYGLVGQALNSEVVERIYQVRRRRPDKPFIILIADISDLSRFKIFPDEATLVLLKKYWPNPLSVILSCPNDQLEYLHRGTKSLAFRVPADDKLRELLTQTGPLVAPSANPEGEPPAKNIRETKNYFGEVIDFYEDAGELEAPPSTLVKIENGNLEVLRPGQFKI